ncbi:hypothetical protein CLOM_g16294 [Closterium sp. NIES-68]|nr:hypothetical protein CLOM_g16294 [Closterium sp. NIES-68]GJP76282.1 hypothetical protein CLOP_g6656 [Closterium sp. NIES-67]GJP81407.1 hypothetical protein CLOP_g11562 [Closterium sp. NIES-67]
MAHDRASRRLLACRSRAFAAAVVALGSFAVASLASAPPSIRGVAPQDWAHFSGSTVACRDGSRWIAASRVNDDFCDCADGTDEPGTSACALARFYCRNRGHTPLSLFSSRVNDGICDCCDGSDEYASGAGCNDTCVQMGAEARSQLAADVAAVREGVKLRGKAIVGHVANREKWEREVKDIEERRAELVEQEKALRAHIHSLAASAALPPSLLLLALLALLLCHRPLRSLLRRPLLVCLACLRCVWRSLCPCMAAARSTHSTPGGQQQHHSARRRSKLLQGH